MSRLRHCWFGIAIMLALVACGRSVPPPTATHAVKVTAKPLKVIVPVVVSPMWQARLPEITISQIPATLTSAQKSFVAMRVEGGKSTEAGALELFLAVLAIDSGNALAQRGVNDCLDVLFERGRIAMREGRLKEADRVISMALSLVPEHPDLAGYIAHLERARAADVWVQKARASARAGWLTQPIEHSALRQFQQALHSEPDFVPALIGLKQWSNDRLQRAWKAAQHDDFIAADGLVIEAGQLQPSAADVNVMALRITELRQSRTDRLIADGNDAVNGLHLDRAEVVLDRARLVAAQRAEVDRLAERIFLARHYGPFKPAQVFSERMRSGAAGVEMIVIAFGRFQMGSPDDGPGHQIGEGPVHEVKFKRGFAIARNEITVADFGHFVEATGYITLATRVGHSTVYDEKGGMFAEHANVDWRRDHVGRIASPTLPVVHVAHADAMAYATWLSAQTGQRYRLPSEAEFEYVLRANTTTIYPWGNQSPTTVVANLTGEGDLSRLGRRWGNAIPGYRDAFWGPAPVRMFVQERMGTFDMIGNVTEWTLDCWHDNYRRAPLDGSAWVNPGCLQRVVRGASWASSLDHVRSAARQPIDADTTSARLGFRVVREL